MHAVKLCFPVCYCFYMDSYYLTSSLTASIRSCFELMLFVISIELPYWISKIVIDLLTINVKLELFFSSQVFMFINIELHLPFYHWGILFSVLQCFTISSSFQGPYSLLKPSWSEKSGCDLSFTLRRYCINIFLMMFQWTLC